MPLTERIFSYLADPCPLGARECDFCDTGKDSHMERLVNTRNVGMNAVTLRKWGLLFLAAGVIGRGVIQNHLLGIGTLSVQQLLELMQSSSSAMTYATVSIILQALETCAAPVFALLLVEGMEHTSDFKQYFLRVLGLAALTEIPYNLAISGKLFALDTRNPVFGLVLCLVMLYLFRYYAAPGAKNVLMKAVVTVAAFIWAAMLKIDFGACLVLIVCVLWAFRKNTLKRNFAGATAAIVCSAIEPLFLASPMGFLAVHMYNGEEGEPNRKFNYFAYPVMLLIALVFRILL